MVNLVELAGVDDNDPNGRVINQLLEMQQASNENIEKSMHSAAAARELGAKATAEIAKHEKICGERYDKIDAKQEATNDTLTSLMMQLDKEKFIRRTIAGGMAFLVSVKGFDIVQAIFAQGAKM